MKEKNRIKEIREHFNLTVEAMSNILLIPQRTIGSYERGENPPNEKFLIALIENFNININWFLTGKGDMFICTPDNNSSSYSSVLCNLTHEQLQVISNIINTDLGKNLLLDIIDIKKNKINAANRAIAAIEGIKAFL